MKPFFSIVIPLYNKEKFIANTLNSALNQNFKDFEIIIVNDGSTDASLNQVKTFKDPRIVIINIDNQGVSVARNLGFKKAKADFICLLDADDLWKPSHLEDLKHLIDNHPGCGLYCTAYEKSYFGKEPIKSTYYDLDDDFSGIVPDYFNNSLINEIASGSSVAIPKKIFSSVGQFDLELRSGQDTDLWIRIALKNKVAFSSKVSVMVIFSDVSNHLSSSSKIVDRLKILKKYISFEKENRNFKKYMDLNRFSIALERKNSSDKIWKSIVKDIDFNNLNIKQKILLKSPKILILYLKKFQNYLLKHNIYLSAFK